MNKNRIRNEIKGKNWNYYIAILCGCVPAAILLFLAFTTVYSADDYLYSTFMNSGIRNYLSLMKEHYLNINGRMLVHFFAQLITHFNSAMFCFVSGVVWAMILCSVIKAEGCSKDGYAVLIGTFFVGILVMPPTIMNQGMLWISAFCNYMLPVALFCVLLALLENAEKKGWSTPALLLMAFVCGATTEQMGVVSVAVIALYALESTLRKKFSVWKYWCSLALALVGVFTILLSPATGGRMDAELAVEAEGSVFASLLAGIEQQVEILSESWGCAVVLTLTFVLLGLFLWEKTSKKFFLWMGAFTGGISIAELFLSNTGKLVIYACICVMLVACGSYLIIHGDRVMGALLMGAVMSTAVMLPTDSIAARTMLPFYVCITVCMAIATAKVYGSGKEKWIIGGLVAGLVVAVVGIVPTVSGYWCNYQIDEVNKAYAASGQETGSVYYCMDYDMDYTHTKAFSDGYFYTTYLQSIGLEGGEVYFYSQNFPVIYCGDIRMHFPAITQNTQVLLLPIREVVTAFGGSLMVYTGSINVTFA